jgi:sugar-specific transcriptional regulator TrmB
MLTTLLKNFDLTEPMAVAYVQLLDRGPMSAQEISKLMGVPRSTVYGYLSELAERGLVTRDADTQRSIFTANNPSTLQGVVENTRAKLRAQEESLSKLQTLLAESQRRERTKTPVVQYYQGKQQVEQMLYTLQPEWRKSYTRIGSHVMWGYQDHTFVEQYRRWHDHAWKTRQPNEQIKLFSNSEGVKQQKQERINNREIRALPKGIHFSSSIWLHGEYIILAMTREKPHYAVSLFDPIFSANLRAVFQMLWEATSTRG